MDVEGIDRQRRLHLDEPIQVDVGDDEATGAAVCVLEDPLQVVLDRDRGPGQAMEDRDLLLLAVGVVRSRYPLEKGGEEGDEPRHRIRVLELRHGSFEQSRAETERNLFVSAARFVLFR